MANYIMVAHNKAAHIWQTSKGSSQNKCIHIQHHKHKKMCLSNMCSLLQECDEIGSSIMSLLCSIELSFMLSDINCMTVNHDDVKLSNVRCGFLATTRAGFVRFKCMLFDT